MGSDADHLPLLLPEGGTIRVMDCAVRWYGGGAGDPTLVLVYGGAAHAGWWEPVLPALSARQRVIAVDLSGHGDSGHRPEGYPSSIWVTEVGALLRELSGGPAAVVGHSLGGRIGDDNGRALSRPGQRSGHARLGHPPIRR